MKKTLLVILMMFGLVSTSWGAESLTQSIEASGSYKVYNLVWVSATNTFTATELADPINGIVMLVEFIPSATAAPTAAYDVTLRNSSGIDILGDTGAAAGEAFDGAGANLSATVPFESQPTMNGGGYGSIPVMGKLTLDVLSPGTDKGGTVRIHYVSLN